MSIQKPDISVIIPLYNKESIIERTIKSVLSQSFTNFEVVIINDGSTDGSMDIVRSISDPRIVIIEQENGGPSKARNTGANIAKGEWIVFLDADDQFMPHALETFYNLIVNNKDFNVFECNRYYQKKESKYSLYRYCGKIRNNFKSWFYREIEPGTGTTIYHNSIIRSFPYNEKYRRYEDAELLFRLLKKSRIYAYDEIVEIHNLDYSSASTIRNNILDDYVAYLDFTGLSFWERMCMYKLYIEERDNYPEDMRRLYPKLYKRGDLYCIYQILNRFKSFFLLF